MNRIVLIEVDCKPLHFLDGILITTVYKGVQARDVRRESMADEFIEKPSETSTPMRQVGGFCREIAQAEEEEG